MSKNRAQHWSFQDPVYGGRFELSRCTRKEFVARARIKWDKDVSPTREPMTTCCFVVRDSGESRTLLWFPLENSGYSIEDIGIVTHEVIHGVLYTLMHRGVNADMDHHEPYAYYVEWLLTQCLERLRG